ncbi:hypothetical protein V6N12_000887 [Hibiscus sabdariffa]|uniref:Uncharacterized protein n=1 Tax=Hibiscus sabdariffa TaxID=183260 RepID=A0ABR2BXK1_9ROSI
MPLRSAAFSHFDQSAVQDLSSGGDTVVGTVNRNLGRHYLLRQEFGRELGHVPFVVAESWAGYMPQQEFGQVGQC